MDIEAIEAIDTEEQAPKLLSKVFGVRLDCDNACPAAGPDQKETVMWYYMGNDVEAGPTVAGQDLVLTCMQ